MITVREARAADGDAIWEMLEPVIRSGETYTLPRDLNRERALTYWNAPEHQVFVAEMDGHAAGTYFLRPNQQGGGSHVANCGYVTLGRYSGRGVARHMCEHSLTLAKAQRFRAMQFNFVVSSNDRAVKLWHSCGFEIVGRLSEAFLHPRLGYVDALVMYRML